MASIDDRISKLETQLKQAKALKQKAEAGKRAIEARQRRSEDTRRKILVGAIVLPRVESGDWPEDRFRSMLDEALTRDDDRALCELPPMSKLIESGQEEVR